ncbi:hypothetical protein, partial [Pseudomonas gingeri]
MDAASLKVLFAGKPAPTMSVPGCNPVLSQLSLWELACQRRGIMGAASLKVLFAGKPAPTMSV